MIPKDWDYDAHCTGEEIETERGEVTYSILQITQLVNNRVELEHRLCDPKVPYPSALLTFPELCESRTGCLGSKAVIEYAGVEGLQWRVRQLSQSDNLKDSHRMHPGTVIGPVTSFLLGGTSQSFHRPLLKRSQAQP